MEKDYSLQIRNAILKYPKFSNFDVCWGLTHPNFFVEFAKYQGLSIIQFKQWKNIWHH